MSFEYLTNLPLEQAKEEYSLFLRERGFAPGFERIAASKSLGRVTSEPVRAVICAPHYAASAMDGIAVSARNTFGASETSPVTLLPDCFTVVDTGDPVPEGSDAVIMVEDIVRNADGSITLHAPAAPWQHIRQIGEDICAGEMILPSYSEISPAAIGSMIAGGVGEISVIKKPLVGIIPTGDEIVPPCSDPKPGDILEFNSSIFSGMLRQWNCEAKTYPIVRDRFEDIKNALVLAAGECDIVLINAGSSAGRDDYTASALRETGEVMCHGIAIKPGKPAILAAIGSCPVLGVPGYPVSGIIVIEQLLKPLITEWYHGCSESGRAEIKAVLSKAVVSGLKYEEFVRVRLGSVNGRVIASPLARGAGVVSSFMKADGILRVPQSCEGFEAGTEVDVSLLTDIERIKNTIVVIGSHDPLLDELSNLLHSANGSVWLSSSHVGSMGGIMAVRRGEAHAAGCHLLDTETGEYNLSYMRKYFPDHQVKLIRCVGRTQGIMTAPGNPLGIKVFSDICKPGLRYVNRQKGSGTRILTDYLMKREGIRQEDVYGYDREELTHTSVAAQIASGSADAGMGIYSAANLYGLDFVPVCTEEYDLIIPCHAFDTPMISALLDTLKSQSFKDCLMSLGGYTLENPGEEIEF